MDSELTAIITAANAEATARVGESLTGPDLGAYTGIFRAATAFDLTNAGLEMSPNGFPDMTYLSLTIPRAQFTAVPWSWRRNPVRLIRAKPLQKCTVASVNADDPINYVFILIHHQPKP